MSLVSARVVAFKELIPLVLDSLSGFIGLTPRAITELFNILDRDSGKYTFSIRCYMLELYQDDLQDLLLPQAKGPGGQKVGVVLPSHSLCKLTLYSLPPLC